MILKFSVLKEIFFKYFLLNLCISLTTSAMSNDTDRQMCTHMVETTRLEKGKMVKYVKMITKCCDDLLRVNNECRPYCQNCECLSSNVCQCKPLYTWNDTTLNCEPLCDCLNGYCPKPLQCSCFEGYEKAHGNYEVCEPICKPGCPKYSRCKRPNVCECEMGYEQNMDTNECEAICDGEIYVFDDMLNKCVLKNCICQTGGYCLKRSEDCQCYSGYRKLNASSCEPICQPQCINAKCIDHNHCECLQDYHSTKEPHICESNDMCRQQSCINGECLANGICKCKKGYHKSLTLGIKVVCESTNIFVGKIMTLILAVPLLGASIVICIVYIVAKRRANAKARNDPIVAMYHYGPGEDEDQADVTFVNGSERLYGSSTPHRIGSNRISSRNSQSPSLSNATNKSKRTFTTSKKAPSTSGYPHYVVIKKRHS